MSKKLNFNIQWKDPIDIDKEKWIKLLRNTEIFKQEDIELLKLIYISDDFMARASELAVILNLSHFAPLNSQVGRLGKRIANNINIQAPKWKNGNGYNWWHIPFLGYKEKNKFYWILRPELKQAMDELISNNEMSITIEIAFPEEIDINKYQNLHEGAKKLVYVNRYERSTIAREICIKHYGTKCIICDFEFKNMYGEHGKDIIHVHHLKPLNEIGTDYKIDPIKDLVPVCPNCHLVLHKRNPPFSVDEVREMIKNNK